MGFPGQEAWLNHFYPALDTLLDFLPAGGLLSLFDEHRFEASLKRGEEKFHEDIERFRKESAEKRLPFPDLEGIFLSFEEMKGHIGKYQKLKFSPIDLAPEKEEGKRVVFKGPFNLEDDLEVRIAGKGRASMAPLAEKISSWTASGAKVVLVTRTEQQAQRLRDILVNYDVEVDSVVEGWSEVAELKALTICIGRLSSGFVWLDLGLCVISEDEIFGAKRATSGRRSRPSENALAWSSFSQLKEGDAVVHEDHGIGLYVGLTKMEIQKRAHDFVIVEYANNDRLYIPADRVSVLQKYVGVEEGEPKLDRLGGRSWDLIKQRTKRSVKRIAKQLIELYAVRKYRTGFSFSAPDHLFAEFEATFEHEETSDQVKAINDVLDDMCSERPMDRLICGDVGFGKTEVALRAAFKAVTDGKQVAVLVPTTVLAEQHFETFHKRMDPYSISVGILSRFRTDREQSEILAKLRSGKLDVLIGTHRMLQKDVKFKDLGLLVVDEEQRFGVKQKEALKKYRSLVDVLAITATPIPRTFQMSMMGVRDLTVIETPPEDRLAIQTYLSRYDEALIGRAVRFEMERGGQVFFVHNKVRSIDLVIDRLRALVPEARMAVAHGQMKGRNLENTMLGFIKKEFDVLVCTTIIESGLDIPSANTIIINEADRLGLAQIYQLRGRVGRSDEKAYAYLLVSENANLTRDAEKRLKALMDFTHLGAGLHLAMHDLKIRGGGNVLGFSQSGHISAVGYELYLKLIEQAMAELKGEEWHEDINPEINADIPAFLPGDYVIDTDVRLNLYRRLSGIRDKSELGAIEEEIRDRFGPPPEEVKNLLKMMSLRLVLKKAGVSGLDVGKSALTLTFALNERMNIEKLLDRVNLEPRKYRFIGENRLRFHNNLNLPEDFGKVEEILESLQLV
jgi:transcription-repair coupling factor (superfamily II helicase)